MRWPSWSSAEPAAARADANWTISSSTSPAARVLTAVLVRLGANVLRRSVSGSVEQSAGVARLAGACWQTRLVQRWACCMAAATGGWVQLDAICPGRRGGAAGRAAGQLVRRRADYSGAGRHDQRRVHRHCPSNTWPTLQPAAGDCLLADGQPGQPIWTTWRGWARRAVIMLAMCLRTQAGRVEHGRRQARRRSLGVPVRALCAMG